MESVDDLLVQGGSRTAGFGTVTSDIDMFAVVRAGLPKLFDVLTRDPEIDLEVRSVEWFVERMRELERFSPRVSLVPPAIQPLELRFLIRVCLGVPIADPAAMHARLSALAPALQRMALEAQAAAFVNLYQDIVGLLSAERHQEALLLSGELAARGLLVSVLQFKLADPTPKWAWAYAQQIAGLQERSHTLLDALRTPDRAEAFASWSRAFLRAVNAVVAWSLVASPGGQSGETSQPHGLVNCASPTEDFGIECCVLPLPQCTAMVDTLRKELVYCNRVYLEYLASCS